MASDDFPVLQVQLFLFLTDSVYISRCFRMLTSAIKGTLSTISLFYIQAFKQLLAAGKFQETDLDVKPYIVDEVTYLCVPV